MLCTAWLWAPNTCPLLPLSHALASSVSPSSHHEDRQPLSATAPSGLSAHVVPSALTSAAECVLWSTPQHGPTAACREPPLSPPAQPSAVTPARPTYPSESARLASSCKADKLNVFPMIFQQDEDVVTFDCFLVALS